MRMNGILALAVAVLCCWSVTAAAAAVRHHQTSYPNSIVAMGHSGITGWNSDPARPSVDAPENSWATGTNPAVDSLYQRLLERNPGIADHTYNVAKSGSDVSDLMRQAQAIAALPVRPELVVIQSIDNDMRCDGSDAANYKPFAAALSRALKVVVKSNPSVHIYFVNQWASARNYANVARHIPSLRSSLSDPGPCGVLDASGKLRPAGIASYEAILAGYYKQITQVCARLAHCKTDRSAVHRMVIQRSDLASDGEHLSVRGQHKLAAVAWRALY